MMASGNCSGAMRRVAIVQRYVAQYQVPFFERLRPLLRQSGIDLALFYGEPDGDYASRGDAGSIPWGTLIRNRRISLARRDLYWQPCVGEALKADLVIVEQASKLLANYVLLAAQMAGARRLAFWGHGRSHTATPASRIGEAVKAAASRRVHWWFAYNDLSARYVRELGFPAERITPVQNAIDTHALALAGAAVTGSEIADLRSGLGLKGSNVCLYAGAMYREKRLPFLIAACELVRRQVPDFEMLFIGSGPDRPVVEEAVSRNGWMRYLGPLFDSSRLPPFRLAKLALMPGGVGLGILDAFALETPLITTAVPYHGPEIDYLEDGRNGVVVQESESPAAYAGKVATLLADSGTLGRLQAGCRRSARSHSVENMTDLFARGVVAALEARPLGRR